MAEPTPAYTDYSQFHPAMIAADTANMQAGADSSLLERAGNFTGSALLSGFASIYNTGASLLGAEKFDVSKWLDENDQHMGAYYNANRELADVAGFIATSFVPGGIALKGLQLAKTGTFAGPFGRALGYASSKQQDYLKLGLEELSQQGGTVFGLINKNKLAAMTWGTADQMLNVAAFETAVALTMKQSPMLEKDEWKDVAKHIALTSLAFGGAVGAIEAIAIHSIFKGATKSIDAAMGDYRTLAKYKDLDVTAGDKAYGIAESVLELPTVGRNIEYTYRLAGKEHKLELPTREALERTVSATERRGWDDFRTTINSMASGDEQLGQRYADYLIGLAQKGKETGEPRDEILARLSDHLLNVGKITRVSEDAAREKDVFYLAEKILPEKLGQIKTLDDFMAAVKNRAPTGANISKNPFEVVGNPAEMRVGIVGLETEQIAGSVFPKYAVVNDAWDDGMDAVVLANGQIRINAKSKVFRAADDPITVPRSYFNTRTGAFTDVAFPTVADIADVARPLRLTGVDHIVSGGKNWTLKTLDEFNLAKISTLESSARYVWANPDHLKVVPHKIRDTDVPLLERILQDGPTKWKDVVLRAADDTERPVSSITDFGEWLKQQKLSILQGFFVKNPKGADIVELATKLNVEPDWVQRAIASNFTANTNLDTGFSISLRESLKPQNLEIRWDFEKAKEVSKQLTGKEVKSDVLTQGFPGNFALASNRIYGELGFSYRVKLAKQAQLDAFTAVMGAETAAKFMDLGEDAVRKMADQLGAGAGIIKFSNADYGDTLRLVMQYSGQMVSILGKRAANETLTRLNPLMLRIKDEPKAAGELGVLVTALRRTPDKFVIDEADKFKLLNADATTFNKKTGGWELDKGKAKELEAAGRRVSFTIENETVADFMGASTISNGERLEKMKVLMTSRGFNYNYNSRVVYAPPVDTARYPFFAFVRKDEKMLGGSSDVSMITARTEGELKALADKVPEGYIVQYKDNTEKYFKIKGEYDYALTLKEPTIDSTLQKRGVLGDFFPETRAENVLDDFINFHQRQEVSLVRRAVETRYAQTFAELRAIGEQYQEVATSKFSGILKKFRSQTENPFEDYIKTALDISKRSEYTLLHEANEFAEALGKSAYRVFETNKQRAMEGTISWQDANKLSEKYGIAGPYRDPDAYFKANLPEEKNIVREFVSKANMFLVNTTLRLDWANSLVNIISTPILLGTELASIRTLIANDSALVGKLAELRSIAVPGTSGAIAVPSSTKLIARSLANFWGESKAELLTRYKDIGAVKDMLSQYHEMIEHFSYKPYAKVSALVERGNKAVEIGAKISGNEFAEQLTRFVSADVMRQLTDPIVAAGKLSLAEQNAYISVFVNRVQGNYLSSQRPILFQGVLGSAVSLFQTYQFNLLQQLFRHIENRDTRALATLGGLQGGIYGLNGVPFFEAVNTHLIGNSKLNPEHKDVYSTVPQIAGKELGDWMMYGTASAFPLWSSSAPSLYTRGDINPRHISIIPISPLDVPAVNGSIRFLGNLVDMGKKMVSGADISSTLLEGVEHNGLSRPLAGIAQVVSGYNTTSKGSLISANIDFASIATASRILGAKPVDESIALNSLFRLNAYQAADQERIQQLGEVVKTKLRNGKLPPTEDLEKFQLEYAKAGGRIENYSKTLQRWSRDANVSVVNQLAHQHRSSYSRRMQEIMGGATLSDYRTKVAPPTEPNSAAGNEQKE